jgi:hydrogenase/urease accessory protein HupE
LAESCFFGAQSHRKNPKSEVRTKVKIQMTQSFKRRETAKVRLFHNLEFPSFGFVSNFGFRISSSRSAVLLLLVVSGIPARAEAHLNSTGMGPIYDGLMHFLISPEDLVPAFALALLAGLRGAAYGRRASFTLPVAWLAGSLFGLTGAATGGSAVLSSLWFLLLGGLVIVDAKIRLSAMTVLAALLGVVHGYLNGTGMGQSGFAVVALLGLISGVFVLIVLIAAFVVQLRAQWARIAVRVAGSWIAASGLLMLGWSFRGR